jgi:ABC-2 type transport system permease protein
LFRVTRHEFRVTAANKGFVITTIVGPFLILAVAVLPSVGVQMAQERGVEEGTTVAIYAPEEKLAVDVTERLARAGVETRRVSSARAARAAVSDGGANAAVALEDGPDDGYRSFTFIAPRGVDVGLSNLVERTVADAVVSHRLEGAGLDDSEVRRLTEPPAMRRYTPGEGESAGNPFRDAFVGAFAFVFLLYMTVIFYGQMMARSALGERTSKSVEIILSSVDPLELMFGKILGKGLAGLIQYAIWIGLGLLVGTVVGPRLELAVPDALSIGNLAALLVFFVGAFLLYSSAYAAIGAGAADEQHIGQLGIPLLAMLVVPMVLITPIIMAPDSALSVVLSLFPFTAPIVMLVRMLIGSPPAAHVLVSLAILAVSVVLVAWLSARIFRVAILASGTRPSLRQLLRFAARS